MRQPIGILALVMLFFGLLSAQAGSSQAGDGKNSSRSLGEVTGELNAQRASFPVKPANVLTNDDLACATTPAVAGSLPETAHQPRAQWAETQNKEKETELRFEPAGSSPSWSPRIRSRASPRAPSACG
jgi:hypothetical protein